MSGEELQGMKERIFYIDRLRTVLTILVVLHHTAIAYGGAGGWYYVDVTGDDLTPTKAILTLFTGVNQAFFMGFFFLISGYFTPGSFDRKGPSRFLTDRFIRLGIPLAVYVSVIGPGLIYALEYADTVSWLSFYKEQVLTFKVLNFGPLWFAEALLYFALFYAGYRWFAKEHLQNKHPHPRGFPGHTAILLSALAVGFSAFLIRLVFPTGWDVLGLQLGYFASYIFLYAVGIAAYRNDWFRRLTARTARVWLWVSLAAFPAMPAAALIAEMGGGSADALNGGANLLALIYALWEPFVAFGIIMGLIVWFRERFNRPNRFFQWLSDHAFTVYIIHPPIIVGLTILFKPLMWPPGVKFLAAGLIASVCCFLAAAVIRCLPGSRRVL
jgi:peptidoglycan/LPS O-acetylase OafA/YrhL